MTTESAGLGKVRTLVFKAQNNKLAAKWTLEIESFKNRHPEDIKSYAFCSLLTFPWLYFSDLWGCQKALCLSAWMWQSGIFFCLPNCTCTFRITVPQSQSGLSWCCHYKDLSSLQYALVALCVSVRLPRAVWSHLVVGLAFSPGFHSLPLSVGEKNYPSQLREKTEWNWAFRGICWVCFNPTVVLYCWRKI